MTKLTKAALAADNAALRAQIDTLQLLLAQERAKTAYLSELQDCTKAVLAASVAKTTVRVRTVATRTPTVAELEWRAAAEKARALAMSTGRSVAIGA